MPKAAVVAVVSVYWVLRMSRREEIKVHEHRLGVNTRLEHDDVRVVDQVLSLWGDDRSQGHSRLLARPSEGRRRERGRESILDAERGESDVAQKHNTVGSKERLRLNHRVPIQT